MQKKSLWVLLICMLSGLTVGYFLGELCSQVAVLKWINYTGVFGLDSPIKVNLGVICFSLQIQFKLTICAILGLLIGIFVYKKI